MTELIKFIIVLLIGYILGLLASKDKITETEDVLRKKIRKLDKSPVGAVERPSAETVNRRLDKRKLEEEEEMKKAFKDLKIK